MIILRSLLVFFHILVIVGFIKAETQYVVTSKSGLILREGPGINYKKIVIIPYEERITAEFSDINSYNIVNFSGQKTTYSNNGSKIIGYDHNLLSNLTASFQISGRFGYWLKCSYKNVNGWVYSGFLEGSGILEFFGDDAGLLKTIPQTWIPVENGCINIDLTKGLEILQINPDDFPIDGDSPSPFFSINNMHEFNNFVITNVKRTNERRLLIKFKPVKYSGEFEISAVQNYDGSYVIEFDVFYDAQYDNYFKSATKKTFVNIDSASNLPVNFYNEK